MTWFERMRRRLSARDDTGEDGGRGPASGGPAGSGPSDEARTRSDADADACSSSSMACQEALEAVYEYLDGELDDVPAEQVRAHFELCEQCYPHLRFERSFLAAVRRGCRAARAPGGLKDRVAELLAEADSAG